MDKQIITIAGGGSTFTPGVVKALVSKKDFLIKEIRVYDIDKERQENISVITKLVIEEINPEIKFIITTDAKEAFKNANFIFAQLRVGKYKMREKDEKIPLKHGAVGQETCGCGGLAYGLRSISPVIEIIDLAKKYADPNHWVLNYSNPASIVAKACDEMRPNARIINICDMPVGLINLMSGILKVDKSKIDVNYFGLNHFGWFTNVFVDGKDMLQELKEHIRKYGYISDYEDVQHREESWKKTFDNIKYVMDLFPDYIPNTYLQYYLLSSLIVSQSNKDYTRANEIVNGREKKLFEAINNYKQTGVFDKQSFHVGVHGTFIVDLAKSLLENKNSGRFLLIVKNNGIISNVSSDAMVEVPCYVSKRGIEPVSVGNIPTFHKGLIEQQYACEKLIVEGAFENSYTKILEAFTLNATTTSALQAKLILDEMIEENKEYWPQLN